MKQINAYFSNHTAVRSGGLQKFLYDCSCLLLLIFCGYITFRTMKKSSYADFFAAQFSDSLRLFLLILLVLTLVALLLCLLRIYQSLGDKNKRLLLFGTFAVMALLQLLVVWNLKAQLTSDMLTLFNEALSLFHGNKMQASDFGQYFAHYTNNHFFCFFTVWLLKLASFLGIPEGGFLLFLQFVNLIFIDTAIVLTFFFLRAVAKKPVAPGFLFLCLLFPMTYLLPEYYYTSTVSMPFSIGLLMLLSKLSSMKFGRKKILGTVLFSLLFFVSMKIRATSIIFPVAFFIYLLLSRNALRCDLKRGITLLAVFLCTWLCLGQLYSGLQRSYNGMDASVESYPATHWIMMGIYGNGCYSTEDDDFTAGFSTYEERKAANIRMIKERLAEQGPSGLFALGKEKLNITWSGSLYDYLDYLTPGASYSRLTDFVLGDRRDFFVTWMRAFHTALFLLTMLGCVGLIRRKETSPVYLIFLSFLGGIIFHLIWETGSIYGIPFLLLLLGCAAEGLCEIQECPGLSPKPLMAFSLISVAGLGICVVRLFPALTQIPFENTEYAIRQDIIIDEAHSSTPLLDGSLEQTFKTSRSFNELALATTDGSEDNTSLYAIFLLSEDGTVLYAGELAGSDAEYFTPLSFDTVIPVGTQCYTIRIEALRADADNHLTFATYDTGQWDVYADGSLKKNGQIQPTADLSFTVSLKINKTFF